MNPPTTLLLDASNLICRAFIRTHADREKVVRDIRRTVHSLQGTYKADYILAGIDHERNFRRELHPEYKGKRKCKPAALEVLLGEAAQIMLEVGALPLEAEGYEADDVLATLAAHAPGRTVIVTADTDLSTVVSHRVSLHLPSWERMGQQQIKERYDLEPHQIVLFKALRGDSKDNFRGVKHLTHEEALGLARQFSNVDDLLGNLSAVPKGTAHKIRSSSPGRLRRNYALCKLVENAPVVPAVGQLSPEIAPPVKGTNPV